MKVFLLTAFTFFIALVSSAQVHPTDLFFSEYVEGSGNNKALEIYNPTPAAIDLSSYWVLRFSNGSSVFAEGGSCHLTGTIQPYGTFVLVNGQTTSTASSPACSPVLQAMANQLDGIYPAPTYMNGNDAIALVKTPGGVAPSADMSNVTPVDLFGEIGLGAAISAETGWSYVKDTTLSYKNNTTGVTVTGKVINYIVQAKATDGSTFGPFWMSWTSDHTLIRKPNVLHGVVASPSPFVVTLEWDTAAAIVDTAGHFVYKDIWSNLGQHNCRITGTGDAQEDLWLTIYPNPVTDGHLSITSKEPVRIVEIYTVTGQLVSRREYDKALKQIDLITDPSMKGIYLVKVISGTQATAVRKIIVN
jgi:hypothetical protein